MFLFFKLRSVKFFILLTSKVHPINVLTANKCVPFLVADTQLYKRLCPSVGRSVGRSVGLSVTLSFFSSFYVILSHFKSF